MHVTPPILAKSPLRQMLYEKTGQQLVLEGSFAQSAGVVQTWTYSTEASPFVWHVSVGMPSARGALMQLPQYEFTDSTVQPWGNVLPPSGPRLRIAVAQHIPASGSPAQSALPVHATTSLAGQLLLHFVVWFTRSAQQVSELGQATWGQVPPPSVLPPLLPPELPPAPPLLPVPTPPELPLLLPPELPAPIPLELPETPPLEEPPEEPPAPPPSSEVVDELLPHAIQTSVLATTAAAPNEIFREIREIMGTTLRCGGGTLPRAAFR
jgi:hypothetical protein